MTLSRPLVWLLLAVPIIAFAALLLTQAVNIPWFDDIEAFVGFFAEYLNASTLSEKLYWLSKPNNEHRIVFGKLVAVGTYALTGQLNFRTIILVGGVFLLATLWVLFRVFRWQRTAPLLLFVPVLFILLQPQYHLTSLWAITSTQHIGAAFFLLSSFYFLAASESTPRFWLAVVFQIVATLTMSIGLFGWFSGAFVLVAQRRYAKLAGWVVLTVVTFWLYFYGYTSPQGNETSVGFFLKYPYLVFFGFFTFIGSLFDFFPKQPILWRSILPTLAGFAVFGSTVWLLWRQGWRQPVRTAGPEAARVRQRYFWLGAYGFLLVNALAVGFLRPRFGYEVMLVSNYMLYPALWVSLLYLHWVSEQHANQHRRSVWIGLGGIPLGGSVLIWAILYNVHWPILHERRHRLLALAFDQRTNGAGLAGYLGTPLGTYIDQQMRHATTQGFYTYPAVHPALPDSLLLRPAEADRPFFKTQVTVNEQPDRYLIELVPDPTLLAQSPTYLLLQSDRHTYLVPNEAPIRFASFVLNRPVVAAKGQVLKNILHPGTYHIGWATVAGGRPQVRYTEGILIQKSE